ncbi:MAG TPA: BTAD domain-containing putative transcriptional regulator [Thermoanaerobaculia bacterium]|nr:BTAD domain-containing putative transcriptional regulator [Thermoanaerobaculia bacterium]
MSSEPYHLFPQVERLLRGVESRESPLVQLWSWPGSGGMAVLEALLARQGRRALGLPLATMGDETALREALEAAREVGIRWLVTLGEPPAERLATAERWLLPGQRLVFASRRRWPAKVPLDVVPPQELLLDPAEVSSLCLLLTGDEPAPPAALALWEATDGWHRPLRLALETAGGAGLEGIGPDALLDLPAVRLFLRQEVLDALPEAERELLLDVPDERPAAGEAGEEGWRAIDSLGLWLEGPARDRLPRLFAALLARERRRRRPRATRPAAPPPAAAVSAGERPAGRLPVYVLGLLGSPLARQRDEDGERDLDCRLRRSFQVLAYLASSPGLQAGREELIEAVWPTEGERTIERNFHPTLSHLRRALEGGRKGKDLPPPLLFRAGFYRLNPEVTWQVDVIDFNRLSEEGKEQERRGELEAAADSWQRAWKLYRGPFLQGYYEGWVTARRESAQRLYLELLRELGDLYVRLQKPGEALDAYRTVLLEDPLNERVHLAVMHLYAQQGRRDLVRRQYDKLCSILLDELGVPPHEETTRGYHQLME